MRNKGFTLIEMVVVIAVLAVLALLIIPKLGNFAKAAESAQQAHAQGSLQDLIELHKAAKGGYPDGIECLNLAGASAIFDTNLYATFADTNISAESVAGLKNSGIGFYHNIQATGDVMSYDLVNPIVAAQPVSYIKKTAISGNPIAEAIRLRIIRSAFPSGVIPADREILVTSIGQGSTLVGSYLNSMPTSSDLGNGTFTHFIVCYVVPNIAGDTSRFARLAGVFTPAGNSVSTISDSAKSQLKND